MEADLNYNYFRDYDPVIGRYVESDPMGLLAGLNTYRYVADPLRSTDPKGLITWTGNFELKGASWVGGIVWGTFDLLSECVDDLRVRVSIAVRSLGVDFSVIGSPFSPSASYVQGDIEMEDGATKAMGIDAYRLNGVFEVGALVGVYGPINLPLTSISLGQAGSQRISNVIGLDPSFFSYARGSATIRKEEYIRDECCER